jgi:hypothetical protein
MPILWKHSEMMLMISRFGEIAVWCGCGFAGSGTGGTNPGLPLDADPLDAHRTDRLDDPEELLKRRRAKDPAAFDKVHGKGASFAEETGGKGGGEMCFVLTSLFCSPSAVAM